MRQQIFAHTETGGSKPGYVAISREENGQYSVSVRNPGGNVATVHLSLDEFARMGVACAGEPTPSKRKGK